MGNYLPNLPKAISRHTREELENAVDEKKALPDLVLKRAIFSYYESMIRAKQAMLISKARNNGVANVSTRLDFRFAIMGAFDIIWGIVDDARILNLHDVQRYKFADYQLCMMLPSPQEFPDSMLVHLSYYVYYCLHRLNLTNLFVDDNPNDDLGAETY